VLKRIFVFLTIIAVMWFLIDHWIKKGWNDSYQISLKTDMSLLLERSHINPSGMHATMVPFSSEGYGEFTATAAEIDRLATNLHLSRVRKPADYKYRCTCDACSNFKAGDEVTVFVSEYRPRNLRFTGGRAFSTFAIFAPAHSDRINFQFSYAFG